MIGGSRAGDDEVRRSDSDVQAEHDMQPVEERDEFQVEVDSSGAHSGHLFEWNDPPCLPERW